MPLKCIQILLEQIYGLDVLNALPIDQVAKGIGEAIPFYPSIKALTT